MADDKQFVLIPISLLKKMEKRLYYKTNQWYFCKKHRRYTQGNKHWEPAHNPGCLVAAATSGFNEEDWRAILMEEKLSK